MGPEKRLPLALFACFIAVLGLQLFTADDKVSEEDRQSHEAARLAAESGATPDADGLAPALGAGSTPADTPASIEPRPVSEIEPWSETFTFGAPDQPGYMSVRFDSLAGSIAEIRLGQYYVRSGLNVEERADPENWVRLVVPVVEAERTLQTLMVRPGLTASKAMQADISRVHWAHEVLEDRTGVRFTHEDASGLTLIKTIRSEPEANRLSVTLGMTASNEAFKGKSLTLNLVAAVGVPAEGTDAQYPEPRAVAARVDDDPVDVARDLSGGGSERDGSILSGELAYVGSYNKYFGLFMRPADDAARAALQGAKRTFAYDQDWASQYPVGSKEWENGFRYILAEAQMQLVVPEVGAVNERSFMLYAGPKDAGHFGPGDEMYADILQDDLGFFDTIASLILGFLRFLHGIFGNWGWSIIVLTIVVRMMLFPLQRRMQTSMARHATKMRRVQPKIDAVKEKYAKDPQKLRQEQARVMQEEGAMPPILGCLPMLLQIPIFFGLFSALRVAFDLRHQPFIGWIKDLSLPDRLAEINFDTHIPFIGEIQYFNLLPILMVVLWVGQQRVMPKPAAMNDQAKQMQKIMMWMPIMFGFFLYNYASGLSLYMITTSFFGILESTVIRKVWPIDETEQPKKKGKFMARFEEMQKQALALQEAKAKQQGRGGGGSKSRGGSKGKRK